MNLNRRVSKDVATLWITKTIYKLPGALFCTRKGGTVGAGSTVFPLRIDIKQTGFTVSQTTNAFRENRGVKLN